MIETKKNYAFIDSNNLYLSISRDIYRKDKKIYSGWKLDYRRFRVYLRDKYKVEKAFLFIGLDPNNYNLYNKLKEFGYICVFKPTLKLYNGKIKGNVDAELVLYAMLEYSNYNKAIIVSGDGDFYCLIKYFIDKNKLEVVLAPNQYNYSFLLNKLSSEKNNILKFINKLKDKLEYKKS